MPSKSVTHGQFSTSFHITVLKSAAPPPLGNSNQSSDSLGSESTPGYDSLSLEAFAGFIVHSFPGENPT